MRSSWAARRVAVTSIGAAGGAAPVFVTDPAASDTREVLGDTELGVGCNADIDCTGDAAVVTPAAAAAAGGDRLAPIRSCGMLDAGSVAASTCVVGVVDTLEGGNCAAFCGGSGAGEPGAPWAPTSSFTQLLYCCNSSLKEDCSCKAAGAGGGETAACPAADAAGATSAALAAPASGEAAEAKGSECGDTAAPRLALPCCPAVSGAGVCCWS